MLCKMMSVVVLEFLWLHTCPDEHRADGGTWKLSYPTGSLALEMTTRTAMDGVKNNLSSPGERGIVCLSVSVSVCVSVSVSVCVRVSIFRSSASG